MKILANVVCICAQLNLHSMQELITKVHAEHRVKMPRSTASESLGHCKTFTKWVASGFIEPLCAEAPVDVA